MRTKLLMAIVFVATCSLLKAQEKKDKNLEIYGFVRADLFTDSYKGLNAAKDQFYLLPLYDGEDAEGNDVNEHFSSNLVSMASRIGLKFYGPQIFGAKTFANIEGDFAGNPSSYTAVVRIRQANVRFNWERSSLTLGQTWHPLWGGSVSPIVGSLNTGAPFQPFNRSPQIRYDYNVGALKFTGAGIYEFQYVTNGPKGKSDQYQRNAGIPELFGGAELNLSGFTLGGGLSYKTIKPMLLTAENYLSSNTLNSLIIAGYAQYKTDMFTVKAKTTYGQNTSFLLMPGGFGVSGKDDVDGDLTYTNYNNMNAYVNAVYGKKWQLGIFYGFMKNFGTSDALINVGTTEIPEYDYWGTLPQIQSMFRIAPHIAHNVENARFVFEYEHTMAEYGVGDITPKDGLFNSTVKPVNNRFLLMFIYFF